jgi:low affinity Fe/Cu permease
MIPPMVKRRRTRSIGDRFEGFSRLATEFTGSTTAFGCALGVIVVWAVLGPIFGFSDTWQLVINTSTTIVTFLMVFLIQRSQNKDSLAIHLKLNELVAAMQGSSNRLIDVEALSEKELAALHRYYAELASLSRKAIDVTESHSVEEARARHSLKQHGKRSADPLK